MDEINKFETELNDKKILKLIKDSDDIDDMYIELENGRKKNECKKHFGFIDSEDTIQIYSINSYNKYGCKN